MVLNNSTIKRSILQNRELRGKAENDVLGKKVKLIRFAGSFLWGLF